MFRHPRMRVGSFCRGLALKTRRANDTGVQVERSTAFRTCLQLMIRNRRGQACLADITSANRHLLPSFREDLSLKVARQTGGSSCGGSGACNGDNEQTSIGEHVATDLTFVVL